MKAAVMTMHPYREQVDDLLARLRKVEGQMRGIQKMLQDDRYCMDVLAQLASAKAALTKVELALLESHTRGCVADAIRGEDGDEKIEELMKVVRSYAK